MITVAQERPEQAADIEALLDRAFGADRHRKRSYFYRDGVAAIEGLCLTAEEDGRLLGTIRYWPIRIDNTPALLLGPVAVDAVARGTGIGSRLIKESLALAEAAGHRTVILVGAAAYYSRFGFSAATASEVFMPEEVQERVQIRFLGAEDAGQVRPRGTIYTAEGERLAVAA